jgi:hypothetical protein
MRTVLRRSVREIGRHADVGLPPPDHRSAPRSLRCRALFDDLRCGAVRARPGITRFDSRDVVRRRLARERRRDPLGDGLPGRVPFLAGTGFDEPERERRCSGT